MIAPPPVVAPHKALQHVQQVRRPLRPPLQVAEPLRRPQELRRLPHVRLDGGRRRHPRRPAGRRRAGDPPRRTRVAGEVARAGQRDRGRRRQVVAADRGRRFLGGGGRPWAFGSGNSRWVQTSGTCGTCIALAVGCSGVRQRVSQGRDKYSAAPVSAGDLQGPLGGSSHHLVLVILFRTQIQQDLGIQQS